uniref:Uncharacterized protein n=1 Tax=Arundo donax TaxID=35708 RepID=A0A0A9AXP2_ARUDO
MERVAPVSPRPDEHLAGAGVVHVAEPGAQHPHPLVTR